MTLLFFSEVTSEEPIVVLACGHAFAISSVDRLARLQDVYDEGRAIMLPSQLPVPCCSDCRQPIAGARRYSRVVNHARVLLAQRKYALQQGGALAAVVGESTKIDEEITALEKKVSETKQAPDGVPKKIEHALTKRTKACTRKCTDLIEQSKSPLAQVCFFVAVR